MTTLSKSTFEDVMSSSSTLKRTVFIIIVLCIVRENRSQDFVANPTSTISPASTESSTERIQPPVDSCFRADDDFCKRYSVDTQVQCQCVAHPTIPQSLVCCNITDLSRILACTSQPAKENNSTSWLNVHIRNGTFNELDISHNFWKLLHSLSITDGHITKITNEFRKFSMTKCLNVSNNNLTEIYPRAFTNLTHLQILDISYNNLSLIPNLSVQTNLTVDIRGNPGMVCDSVMEFIGRNSIKFVEPEASYCVMNQTFHWFTSMDRTTIMQLESMKQLKSECPSIPGHGNCTCDKEQMAYQLKNTASSLTFQAKVDCSGLGLTELPRQLPANTIFLNVSNNNITSLSNYFQDVPSYFGVRRLDADNNQISKMDELEGSTFIALFDALYLRSNNIDNIPDYLLSNYLVDHNRDARVLYLGGNKLICDCNSAKVLRIWLMARHNFIPDYDQILCRNTPQKVYALSEVKMCQSPHDWTDYIYYLIASEVLLLMALVLKVSYDYWKFKTAGYLPWPASKMPKLPCDWLCE